jgi:RNA polymerase-binding transcription factor DksA
LEPIEIRKRLASEETWLEQVLAQNSNPLVVESGLEKGDKIVTQQVRYSNHETTREKLKEVEKAIVRLNDGTYGICVDCHKPISQDRLDAYPHVSTCRDCREKRSKSRSASIW